MTDLPHDVPPAQVHLGNRHVAPDYHLGRLVIITMAIACVILLFIIQ